MRAPDFSTFPRLVLGRIDAEIAFHFSTFPRPVLGRIDAEAGFGCIDLDLLAAEIEAGFDFEVPASASG